MLMEGQDPVVHPAAGYASYNDLDDYYSMDEDEHLDVADQEPLPFPTLTGVQRPMAQFLLDIPNFICKESKKVYIEPLMHFRFLHQAQHQMALASMKQIR